MLGPLWAYLICKTKSQVQWGNIMEKIKQYLFLFKQKILSNPIWGKLGQKIIITTTLITALLVGILAWIIRPNPEINQAAVQLAQMANNIRLFYQTKPGYWGLSTDSVIKNNLYAANMFKEGKLYNAFDKPVIVGQDTEGNIVMPGSRNFMVTFPELSKKECTAMAAFKLNERETLSLLQMVILTEGQRFDFTWGGANPLPVTKTEAAKFCGDKNTVAWSFE